MEKKERIFRQSKFGGFNKDDVINYIEKMKIEFYEYKSDVEKTVGELREKIIELEQINSKLMSDCVLNEEPKGDLSESYPVDNINEATSHLKMVADELCDSLCKFLDRLNENSFTVTVEASSAEEKGEAFSQQSVTVNGSGNSVSELINSVLSFADNKEDETEGDSVLDSVLPSYLFK